MNNKKIQEKKLDNLSIKRIDWELVQAEMRSKLGKDIYESWLKKLDLLKSLIIIFC